MIIRKAEILSSALPALYDIAEERYNVEITTGKKIKVENDTYVDVLLESEKEEEIINLLSDTACAVSGLPISN